MGLFGSSGARGVVNEELAPGDILQIAAVTVSFWKTSRVAIGRDTRIASESFANAASAGAASAGADIERLGIIPTPGFQRYLHDVGTPGIMITASHNPPRYAGVKLFDDEGIELGGERLDAVEKAVASNDQSPTTWEHLGHEERNDTAIDCYLDAVRDAIDGERIQAVAPTVAIDPGHGAGCRTTARFCREMGCRVFSVNDTPDGRFPGRKPEPVPEVLEDLCRLTVANDAIVGIAHDGDADRAVFVDANGDVVTGDTILAILATELVKEGDVVVSAVNASDRLATAVETNGGRLDRTPIGSANIVSRVRELTASGESVPLAGEGNGGIFLPTHGLVRDGLLVAAIVLGLAIERPLHDRAADHTGYHLIRQELSYSSETEKQRMLAALDRIARTTAGTVNRTDGVRIGYDDGWALARASGTEPVIRVVAESTSADQAASYVDEMVDALTQHQNVP